MGDHGSIGDSVPEDSPDLFTPVPRRKSDVDQEANPISTAHANSEQEDSSETLIENESLHGLSDREVLIWSERARMVALISAVYSITVFAVSMAAAIALDSASLLSLSLEALADFLGDCLVFWRFSGEMSEATGNVYDNQASVLISFVMLTSCVIVTSGAARKLAHQKHPQTTQWVLYIHAIIFVISTILTGFKVWIARAIKSNVLMLDAVTGGVVAFLSALYILNSHLASEYPELWFLDSTVAILACAFIAFMACRTLGRSDFTNRNFWQVPHFAPNQERFAKANLGPEFRRGSVTHGICEVDNDPA